MNSPSQFTFYGYEQRTNVSRLFQITATPDGLFFGWIADRDYEEMMARFGGASIGQGNSSHEAAQSAGLWENHYATMDVASPQFLKAHDENFAFSPADGAASVTWKLKFTEKASTRFGALDLIYAGKKRRFYLVGQRSPTQVSAALRHALPTATIEPTTTDTPTLNRVESGAAVPTEPVYKRPNWPLLITIWFATLGLSLWIAATYNFWLPLGASAVAPYFYKLMRSGSMIANFHKDSAEQLRRNRANRK